MAFVMDASVTAAWALPDESHPEAESAFAAIRTEDALVPALWWFELRNTLIVAERRKRLAEHQIEIFLRELSLHPIQIDHVPDEAVILRFARKHRLTVYDAAYLELAQREGLPLATLDSHLAAAARSERVKLIGQR